MKKELFDRVKQLYENAIDSMIVQVQNSPDRFGSVESKLHMYTKNLKEIEVLTFVKKVVKKK